MNAFKENIATLYPVSEWVYLLDYRKPSWVTHILLILRRWLLQPIQSIERKTPSHYIKLLNEVIFLATLDGTATSGKFSITEWYDGMYKKGMQEML